MWSRETVWAIQEGQAAFGPVTARSGNLERLSLASPLLGATGWIDKLAQLVALDTGDGRGAGNELADVLHDMFAPLGLCFQRLAVPSDGDPQLAMTAMRRTGRRVCTIYFHTDTLPPGDGWTRPPFALSRHGSRLYGRGTTDAKGAMAAVWAALCAADAVGLDLGCDPLLVFCAEPRVGEHAGLRHLAAEGIMGDHVIYLNGTAAPRIWTASPGILHLSITLNAEGASTHRLDEAARMVTLRLADFRAAIGAAGQEPVCSECCDGDCTAEELCITPVRAGEAGGSRADSEQILVCHAFRSVQDVPRIVAELRQAVQESLAGWPGIGVGVRIVAQSPPVAGADQGPNGGRWQKSLSWGFGFPATGFRCWSGAMASPMGFVQQAGVQEILLGGLRRQGSNIDADDEFTTVEDVEALARSVLAYLSDVSELPTY